MASTRPVDHPAEHPQKPLTQADDDDDLEPWADFGSDDDDNNDDIVVANGGADAHANGGWSQGAPAQGKMQFTGAASIKGSSEMLKMMLLNFATLGITYVS
jgi:hypothetical protein